jgi:threonine dehydratase
MDEKCCHTCFQYRNTRTQMTYYSDIVREAHRAEKKIRNHIRETPLEFSPYLSTFGNSHVYLKLENFQLTGSFKIRGAFNKLLSLPAKNKKKGIITASSGNHGMAVSYALRKLGVRGKIFLPQNTSPTKIEILKDNQANIELYGDDCVKAEYHARRTAEKKGMEWISPYNDPQIIAGQATLGIELLRQLKKIDAVLVPVGGGGLISGLAAILKAQEEDTMVIGCQPLNSCVMYESVKAGRILDLESKPSLSDATAGGIEVGSITLGLCQELVDDFILLTEQEIKEAILLCLRKHQFLIEGAAALPLAAFLKARERFEQKVVVLVLSGSRISFDQLEKILGGGV